MVIRFLVLIPHPPYHLHQVHLPLTEFAAFFRGQQVEDAPPLDLTKVKPIHQIYCANNFPHRLEPLASRPLVECTTSSSSPALALLRSTPFPSTNLSSSTNHFVRLNPIYLCQTSSLLVWFGVMVRVNHCGSSHHLSCCIRGDHLW